MFFWTFFLVYDHSVAFIFPVIKLSSWYQMLATILLKWWREIKMLSLGCSTIEQTWSHNFIFLSPWARPTKTSCRLRKSEVTLALIFSTDEVNEYKIFKSFKKTTTQSIFQQERKRRFLLRLGEVWAELQVAIFVSIFHWRLAGSRTLSPPLTTCHLQRLVPLCPADPELYSGLKWAEMSELKCPVCGTQSRSTYNHYGGLGVCMSCRNFFRRSGEGNS